MAHPANQLTLVADIGGTNTRIALADGLSVIPATVRRYRNANFPGLEAALRQFIADEGNVDCKAACVAVAGPVRDSAAKMTNLDWTIDKPTIARATQAETVAILNDLQAQGHALGHIDPSHIHTIIKGADHDDSAANMVIGVGTGFNIAPVLNTKPHRIVTPSEAGHANLPIRTQEDMDLCQYLSAIHGFPAIEDVLSGRGLERVYAWLGRNENDPRTASAHDIMEGLKNGTDPRACKAGEFFVRMLGAVAGNLALIHLPFGGIYMVGGMSCAFADHMAALGFDTAFRDKGRFAEFMNNFGVYVVKDDYAALTGCAAHLNNLMGV